MSRSKKRKTKPKLSSKSKTSKGSKLGYGQTDRNSNTLRKLEKANQDEKGID